MKNTFVILSIMMVGLICMYQNWQVPAFSMLLVVLSLLMVGLVDVLQTKHSLRRNFPVFGRGRWLMEWLRPFIQQYFVESDTEGMPINRMFRNVVYQRAKGEIDTLPFGTRVDCYRNGYEWIGHSLAAIDVSSVDTEQRVTVGGPDCLQPYSASIFNISAMSFGALSCNAIRALNAGAKIGRFYHNTGEGGISSYHLENGGDLVWQIGTGYFGCRDETGAFSAELFREKAHIKTVKMIEIKLSQGAKPGHGGILPADKNTPEIADIRGVPVATQVNSPPTHTAFKTPLELIDFIKCLRELSGGKPIGFKLAIGRKSEFIAICKAMLERQVMPDFITIDGGEGGTGAAPLEYSNSVGMPLRDALVFIDDCLTGFGLRQYIRLIAAGKIFTGFHLVKNIALGADICNSARGMMLALGCVQSLSCNTNRCPTGVATQDPKLFKGLVVKEKYKRVQSYHTKTVHAVSELIASAGLCHTSELNRTHIYRRIDHAIIKRYDEIYPKPTANSFVSGDPPEHYKMCLMESKTDRFGSCDIS